MRALHVADRPLGPDQPCFIIAEAGVNHNGSPDLAGQLVTAAQQAGADAVKFQSFATENLVTRDTDLAGYQARNLRTAENQYEMLKKLELDETQYRRLKEQCDAENIIFLSTPHTPEALPYLDRLVPLYKIGSGECNNYPLVEHIARYGKPVILSTGMNDLESISKSFIPVLRMIWKVYPNPFRY